MNEEAQKELERILALEPEALTEGDVLFLKARSKYVSKEDKKKFLNELNEEIVVEEKPEPNIAEERKQWSEHPADKKEDDGVDE